VRVYQSAGGFIKEEHTGIGDQFNSDREQLQLTGRQTGQRVVADETIANTAQADELLDVIHKRFALFGRHVGGKTQFGAELERFVHGRRSHVDIVLLAHADETLKRHIVNRSAVEQHFALNRARSLAAR
jgi:hypothetical protein